jgi:hypothetical protein
MCTFPRYGARSLTIKSMTQCNCCSGKAEPATYRKGVVRAIHIAIIVRWIYSSMRLIYVVMKKLFIGGLATTLL